MLMRQTTVSFTSALCWISFWIGTVLVGTSWLYARLQGLTFLTGIEKGLLALQSPDSTVALLLSAGAMLIALGLIFVPLYYSALLVGAFVKILTRRPIRI